MRFQKRDGEIMSAIYEYDGVLAFRHLKQMFWAKAEYDRATLARLAKLIKSRYLTKPTSYQRKTQPIPEPIYWLDWRGIMWVAAQSGTEVEIPANQRENQMRKLAKHLRDHGIRWLREPRWQQLVHDLAVVDFRLSVEKATKALPALQLEEWIHESEFRSDGDTTEYQITGRDGQRTRASKEVYPDSYFVVVDKQRLAQGLLARARFLLELDNATHANIRFGREKVAPGLAYIQSPAYRARFGDNSGRWLIVTTGQVRMKNLRRQAKQVAGSGAKAFFFTTLKQLETGNLLIEPIWQRGERSDLVSLFPKDRLGDSRVSLNGGT